MPANLTITNFDRSGVVIKDPVFDNRVLTAAGAATWPAGAVLGKVTASGKLVRFATGASDGSQIPYAVLTQPVEFTGAGDRTERPLIAGEVRQGKLVDAAGAALTAAAADLLRDVGIIALPVTELLAQDNQ